MNKRYVSLWLVSVGLVSCGNAHLAPNTGEAFRNVTYAQSKWGAEPEQIQMEAELAQAAMSNLARGSAIRGGGSSSSATRTSTSSSGGNDGSASSSSPIIPLQK